MVRPKVCAYLVCIMHLRLQFHSQVDFFTGAARVTNFYYHEMCNEFLVGSNRGLPLFNSLITARLTAKKLAVKLEFSAEVACFEVINFFAK
jgi:hypothetical protein